MSSFWIGDACLFLVELLLKVAIISGICAGLARLIRRRHPSGAHLIWLVGLGAMVMVPALSAVVPWNPVLYLNLEKKPSIRKDVGAGQAIPVSLVDNTVQSVETARHPDSIEEFTVADQNLSVFRSPLIQALCAIWFIGFLAVLIRMVHGLYLLRAINTFGTQPLPCDWMEDAVDAAARRLGLRRSVRVRLSSTDAFPVPITWGVWKPVVVLPEDAGSWSESRLESTLLHELSHVRRCDFSTQIIAELVCAAYWFHPAVWFVSRSLRSDAELAADEAVVRSGLRPSEYASELLSIAAEIRGRRIPFAALGTHAMKNSKIETRLESILSPSAGRRGITTVQVLAGLLIAAAAVPVFASIHASTQGTEQATSGNERTQALSNLKQICLGTIMYAQDYDAMLPYVQQTASVMAITSPYIRNVKIFHSPTKGGKFLYNLNVGGVLTTDIPEPESTVLWLEKLPNPKEKNAVGFVDGHAKLIDEEQRPTILKSAAKKFKRNASSKPLPPNEGLGKNSPFLMHYNDAGYNPPTATATAQLVTPTASAPAGRGKGK